jgi:putative SOS response-associated peptidase YedK
MCGRFCCSLAPDDIKAKLHKDQITNDKDIPWENEDKYRASYNVCPTRYIVAMLQGEQEKTLSSMVRISFSFYYFEKKGAF